MIMDICFNNPDRGAQAGSIIEEKTVDAAKGIRSPCFGADDGAIYRQQTETAQCGYDRFELSVTSDTA
jgi:hypothetical protein